MVYGVLYVYIYIEYYIVRCAYQPTNVSLKVGRKNRGLVGRCSPMFDHLTLLERPGFQNLDLD